MKATIGEGMQLTIDFEKLAGKFRYILFALLIVLTFFLREPTANEAQEQAKSDEAPQEALQEENGSVASQDPAPFALYVNEDELEKAVVLRIIDGETAELQFSKQQFEVVKLVHVDAPNEGERLYEQATQRLRELMIKDSVVEVELAELTRNKDGQLLVYVWKDGANVNLQLVQEGLARIVPVEHPNTKYLEAFYEGQSLAQSQHLNIWQ